VDRTPAVGAIAWWNTGEFGHVAWVQAVHANGTVTWEEYNSNVPGGYSYDTRAASFPTGGYIHFKDMGGNPKGAFDLAASEQPGTVRVAGWDFDPDVPTQAIGYHVYIGGPAGSAGAEGFGFTANASRPDVGAAYPGVGNNHGLDQTITTSKRGTQVVYAYAINAPGTPGENVLLGSRTVTIGSPQPTITSISPRSGPYTGGTSITITGTNLGGATNVTVGGPVTGPVTGFRVDSSTQITATVPAYGSHGSGTEQVRVVTPAGSTADTAADDFSYYFVAPTITSITPVSGPATGGTSVIIAGTNLSLYASPYFGDTAAGFTWDEATHTIIATSPAHVAGTVHVRLADADLSTWEFVWSPETPADLFTYVAIDNIPPTTSVIGLDPGWVNHSINLTFSASDNAGGSGVAKTEFKLDEDGWTTGTACTVPAAADHSADGEHAVSYRSTDAAGNTEATKTAIVRIDTTAPTGSFLLAGGAATTTSALVSADSSVSDSHAPLQMRLSTDGKATWGNWQDYAAALSVTLPAGLGTKTVVIQYRDAAGNVLEMSDAIELVDTPIDDSAPTVVLGGTNASGSGGYRGAVVFTLTASDEPGGSGVASITYVLDGVAETVLGTSAKVSVAALPNAQHVLAYYATDMAANASSEKTYNFWIDTLGPVTSAKYTIGRVNRRVALLYRETDALLPFTWCTRIVIKNGAGKVVKTWSQIGILSLRNRGQWYSYTWIPRARGTYRYYVYAKDLAGNAQSKLGSAKVVVR
jgi:surface antigen